MEVNHFKQYLPPVFEGGYKNNRKYIHAVICVYLLTIIQPEYKKITYHEFITNFEKYVKMVKFEDNPCLFYQSGKQQGQLKVPNENTFVHKWIGCYDVSNLLEEFKGKVAGHIVNTALRDNVFDVIDVIEKEKETYNGLNELQHDVINDDSDKSKKAYPLKAYQETKNNTQTIINDKIGLLQDYKNAIDQQNSQGEVYNPNHDRIIDRYRAMEDEWEED